MTPESFSNHQNNPLLNPSFLEGIGEELATLIKRHNLGWSALHTNALVTLANQISKTIRRKERNMLCDTTWQPIQGASVVTKCVHQMLWAATGPVGGMVTYSLVKTIYQRLSIRIERSLSGYTLIDHSGPHRQEVSV